MKKIMVSLVAVLLFSVSHAQVFQSVEEEIYEANGGPGSEWTYWDDWQGHYSGDTYEMDYSFTDDGYFLYSITVYPGGFGGSFPDSYNELTVSLTDEDANTNFTDYSYPVGVNTTNVTKSGSFYIGMPTTGHSILFQISYLSSDYNNPKYGGVQGACTVHW